MKTAFCKNENFTTRLISLLFLLHFFVSNVHAQVAISGALPAGINTTYTSLTNVGGAFASLNTATGGNIVVTITADLLSETGTNGLNDRSWISLRIIPQGNRIIRGTVDGSNGLIPLNGADSVTIDGLNTGGNSLLIENLSVSNSAETSTIKVYATAQYNTIKNTTILGSSTGDYLTSTGTVIFRTNSTIGGNSFNTITNCKIGNASTGLPTKGIYSNGSGSGNENSNNIVDKCEIYNYASISTIQSNGILIYSNNTNWTIQDNKFYQTSPRALAAKHYAIQFYSATSSGNLVTGNQIGGDNASGTGTYTITAGSANNQFSAILMGQSGSVTDNVVTNISQTTGSGFTLSLAFCGIEVNNSALVSVLRNKIGSQSANSAILFIGANTGRCETYGIYNGNTSQGGTISNNEIGGITLQNSSTGGVNFDGIGTNFNSTLSLICNDNIIGGEVVNSIHNTTTPAGANARLYGIGFVQTKVVNCEGNTIRNLTAAGGPGNGSEICGIFAGSDKSKNIRNNTIYNISHSGTVAKDVVGIYFSGSTTTSLIEKNFIHSLSNSSTSAGDIVGVKLYTTAINQINTVINNIITISATTSNAEVYGIHDYCSSSGNSNKVYHNTISITGSTTSGISSGYYSSGGTVNVRDVRDNIFYNTRSGGTANYSMNVTSTTTLTENYNNLKGSVNGFTMGANSIIIDPLFVNPTSTDANDFVPTSNVTGLSAPINATVPDDFFGSIRSANPKMGAIDKSTTLPVTLISFVATCKEVGVEFKWITASEINNHYFEVEESIDGIKWTTIAKLNGSGNSSSIREYNYYYIQENASLMHYYRLKQVDFDGKTTLSPSISTSCMNVDKSATIRTFPNPAIDHLFIELNSPMYAKGEIVVYDSKGQLVITQTIEIMQGENIFEINTQQLPKNMYVTSLICQQLLIPSIRFVVNN